MLSEIYATNDWEFIQFFSFNLMRLFYAYVILVMKSCSIKNVVSMQNIDVYFKRYVCRTDIYAILTNAKIYFELRRRNVDI